MSGAEEDVRRLLDAKAKREAEAKAAIEDAEVRRRFAQSEKERIQAQNKTRWPAIYAMVRGVFDVWQPSLDILDLQAEIGGHPEITRYFFRIERKDKRAYVALSFALGDDGRLNVATEKFTDIGGTVQPLAVPQFLPETEEAIRPIFADAVAELEEYGRQAGTQARRYQPGPRVLKP